MTTIIRTISNVKSNLAGETEMYVRKKGEQSIYPFNRFGLETVTANLTCNAL